MENLKMLGAQLINELKTHIERTVESHACEAGLTLGQIEQASGLIIQGKTGQNVWDMAVATLVIELVKEGRLRSSVPIERLNTISVAQALLWPT